MTAPSAAEARKGAPAEADVLRFDSELDFPVLPGQATDHAVGHAVDGDLLCTLTPTGRRLFCQAIRATGRVYDSWHPSVLAFQAEHPRLNPPSSPRSWEVQMVNLLAAHPRIAFSRDDLVAVKAALMVVYRRLPDDAPKPTQTAGDPIQHVNKSGQWGLQHQQVRIGGVPHYTLRTPYTFLPAARKLRGRPPARTDEEVRANQREDTLAWLQQNFFDVPVEQWEAGHASPGGSQIVYQPAPYQGAVRNRFKFDQYGLKTCPTVEELERAIDKYYTEEEQRIILAHLERKFGPFG